MNEVLVSLDHEFSNLYEGTGRESVAPERLVTLMSTRTRNRIEEAFGWAKTIAGMAKVKVRGLDRVRHQFTFVMGAYSLIQMPWTLAEVA